MGVARAFGAHAAPVIVGAAQTSDVHAAPVIIDERRESPPNRFRSAYFARFAAAKSQFTRWSRNACTKSGRRF